VTGAGDGGAPGKPPTERLRASNDDREMVAERLRGALDEGRLTLDEYDERIAGAYQALTYADLNALLADIPTAGGVLEVRPMRPAEAAKAKFTTEPRPKPAPAAPAPPRRIPLALMILWTIWGSAVAINVAVWLLVCITTGSFVYPWPLWVAGPSGAALLGVTVGVQAIRQHRRSGA
jgi:hypothetical protein